MNYEKMGKLIVMLRQKKGFTQKQLAEKMNISDRTISKWERGIGAPDISLLSELSDILEVNIEEILKGEIPISKFVGGNMKNTKYFVCKDCGNIVISTGEASVSYCGRKMKEEELQKAMEEEKLKLAEVENEWYITSNHPMEKEHFISFVAFITGDKLQIIKQYPEWDMQVRIQKRGHGKLIWYCTQHGLRYQLI